MKIGIDASRATIDKKTGVERYSYEIIKQLLAVKKHHYLLWSNNELPNEFKLNNVKEITFGSKRFWTQIWLAINTYLNKTDISFIPSHVIPLFGKGKFVVTIHDLAFEYYPKIYSLKELFYQRLAIKIALFKSKSIIVPSLTTKDDLVQLYKADPDNIYVIPHGVDHNIFKAKKSPEVNLGFGINKPYILYAGRLESKKNIVNLINAYVLIRQESTIKHQLVLVGKRGLGFNEIEKCLANVPGNISKDIIITDFVIDKTYQNILCQADIFVMPSWYEGFGMPVLEAMASGVPVIVNDIPCLKELIGHSGLIADCSKPFPLAARISYLVHHGDVYNSLRRKGLIRSKNYNWEICAHNTLEVLENI